MNIKTVVLKCAAFIIFIIYCDNLRAQKAELTSVPEARVGPEDEASQQLFLRKRDYQAEVKLYPVPAADELKISAPDTFKGDTQLLVFDRRGQACWIETVTAEALKDFKLDLNKINLSSGVYYIRLLNNGNSITSKFIKK